MDQGLVPQPWSQEKWEAILEEQRQATLEEQRRNEERSRKAKEESLRRYNARWTALSHFPRRGWCLV